MPAVLVAGAVIMGIGLIDDRWGLDALTKFAGQITAASVLVTMGVAWSVLYIPFGGVGTIVLDQASSILLTLALTVSIVNAMNFVDGLDGLAAGLGLITALAICMFSVGLLRDHGGDVLFYPPAVISVVLAGACLGFLPHNFHRAKIFMGDSGSMLIGLMLAAASTTAAGPISQNAYGARDVFALLSPFLLVVAVMFVPMLDLLLAIVRRTRAGRSAFSPDKMHLHHRLLQIGHSHRRVVLLIYLWVGIVAFGAASTIFFNPRDTAAVMLGAIVVAGVATAIPLLRRRDDYEDEDYDTSSSGARPYGTVQVEPRKEASRVAGHRPVGSLVRSRRLTTDIGSYPLGDSSCDVRYARRATDQSVGGFPLHNLGLRCCSDDTSAGRAVGVSLCCFPPGSAVCDQRCASPRWRCSPPAWPVTSMVGVFFGVGLLLGLLNALLVRRSVASITAKDHPLKSTMALNSATRLAIITVIGLIIAYIFRPAGLGRGVRLGAFPGAVGGYRPRCRSGRSCATGELRRTIAGSEGTEGRNTSDD